MTVTGVVRWFVRAEFQKETAQRTKTIVLSVDVPGTDLSKGTIRTYNQSAMRAEWRGDAATMRQWDEWQRTRRSTATVAGGGARSEERQQATAPLIQGDFQGTRVDFDELDDNPGKYLGQTVSVDAEVDEILGPRMFKIDDGHWFGLGGEMFVYLATTLAALVREDDRVTITGMVKPFVRAEVEREWGWLGLDREIAIDLAKKPVLVASRIVGGNDNVVMVINVNPAGSKPVGTSGATTVSPLSDLGTIAQGDEDLVGRHVGLKGVKVESMAKDGFYLQRSTVVDGHDHDDDGIGVLAADSRGSALCLFPWRFTPLAVRLRDGNARDVLRVRQLLTHRRLESLDDGSAPMERPHIGHREPQLPPH